MEENERAFSTAQNVFSALLKSLEFLIVFDLDPTLMFLNSLSKERRSESGQAPRKIRVNS